MKAGRGAQVGDVMSTDANVAALHAAVACWNAGDLEGYLALYDPEVVLHGYAGVGSGLAGVRQFYQAFWAAFPGCQLALEDVLASGEKVASRVLLQGEHQGVFRGIPPTGRKISVPGITILEFRSAKCIRRWSCMDGVGLLQQLGALPSR
jgi:predicted ester cyclase